MAEITASLVKELRQRTGAGMMDCKAALTDSNGDLDQAIDVLRKKGLKSVAKRAGRVAAEGQIHSYIHAGGKIGVIIELNCETDFVARSDEFKELLKGIAMHIAWANPLYLRREDVPEDVIKRETEIFRSQLTPGQEKVADKILAGKLEKFYSESCLLEQIDVVRDPSAKNTIAHLIDELSAKLGEKLELRRFTRYELGEGIEKAEVNYAEEVAAAADVGHNANGQG